MGSVWLSVGPSVCDCAGMVCDANANAVIARGPRMSNHQIALTVNGRQCPLSVAPETPLLFVLRNDLELNGPKYGCGLGECGACSVLVNGRAVRSCSVTVGACENRDIVTLEGLANGDVLHPVQQAFVEKQAAQCGYCLNGMIMAIAGLLNRIQAPDEADIRSALKNHLCRCGTHMEILAAARRAVELSCQSETGAA